MTVENISLDVKTNAGDAARQVRSLSSALAGVRGAGRSVASGGTHKAVSRIGSAAKSSTSAMGKLFSSIKRIAMYRLLRTALKEISKGFQEGLKNAYAFSRGIGGSLADAMDHMASISGQMKNQMGAAFGELLQTIMPIIEAIVSAITRLMSALSALFAALGGRMQYLSAGETAESWDKATGAAKKYKNTILGFDEINRLNDENGGGGGADSGAGTWEMVDLPDWAERVRQSVEDGDWVSVGEALGEKINEVIKNIDTGKFGGNVAKILTIPIDFVIGFVNEIELSKVISRLESFIFGFLNGIQSWLGEHGIDIDFTNLKISIDNLFTSVSGLASVISDALKWAWENILVPLGTWTIEELAPHLVDLLATAFDFLRTVLEKLAPVLKPLWESVLKPFFQAVGKITIKGLDELTDLLKDLTDLINGNISWQEFIDGLDGVQIALLAIGGVAVITAIGSATTAVSGFVSAVGRQVPVLAASLGNMAKVAAIGGIAVFDGVMVAYDAVKLKEAADTYHEAQLAHNEEMDKALSAYAKLYDDKGKETADAWAKMAYDIDTTNMSFDEAQAAIAEKIEGYWDGIPQNMWDGFKQGWDYYFGEDGKGLWQLFKDAFTNVIDWVKDLLGIHSPSTVFSDIGSDIVEGLMNGFKTKWDEFFTNVQTWWNSLKTWFDGLSLNLNLKGTTVNTNGFSNSVGHFASGGTIENNGSLFIAGEAGPEIVANMGSKTGVMNVDQMEAAVANGNIGVINAVYAMANAIVTAVNSIDTDVVLDGESVADKLYRPMQNAANRYGSAMVT